MKLARSTYYYRDRQAATDKAVVQDRIAALRAEPHAMATDASPATCGLRER